MRIMRAGHPGYEKPAWVGHDEFRRDLCIRITDIDVAVLAGPWWTELGLVDRDGLPAMDRAARPAPCVAQPGAIILTGGRSAGGASLFGLKAGRPVGAQDDVLLAPPVEITGRAGLAAVVGGRSGGRPTVGGYCLYFDVASRAGGRDELAIALRSSRPTYLSLGPYLISPEDPMLSQDIALDVGTEGGVRSKVSRALGKKQIASLLTEIDTLLPVEPGYVILIDALSDGGDSIRFGSNDVITVNGGIFGDQRRRCMVV